MSEQVCPVCGRPIVATAPPYDKSHKPVMRLYVVHQYYGCDTGCCGHKRVAVDEDGEEVDTAFDFTHPYYTGPGPHTEEDGRHFIISMLDDWPKLFPDAEIAWEDCEIYDD